MSRNRSFPRWVACIPASLLFYCANARADYSNTVASFHPLAAWRLNETNAPVLDVVSNASALGPAGNGLGLASPLQGQPGQVGGSFRFSNPSLTVGYVGSRVDVPYQPGLNPGGPFAIEFWAMPAQLASDFFCPVCCLDASQNGNVSRMGWIFYQTGANDWQLRVGGWNGYSTNISGGAAQAAVWQHVVGVYDGAAVSLYVNGLRVAGPALAPGYGPNTNASIPLRIGATTLPNRTFDGWVDEVAIYTNALSAGDITAHYYAGQTNKAGYGALVQGRNPAGYWHLDEPVFVAPVAAASGSLGSNANGLYQPGCAPGVAGVPYSGLGPYNSACLFNGVSGYVGVQGTYLEDTGPLTLLAWVKAQPASDSVQCIAGKGDASYRLEMNWYGYPRFSDGGTGDAYSVTGPTRIDDGQWHHLAGAHDPVRSLNQLYVDGALVASNSANFAPSGTANDLWIGGAPDHGTARIFNGAIEEVAMFTNALSSAQVAQIYTSAIPPLLITSQPRSQAAGPGVSVLLTVTAAGPPPLGYQWQSNNVSLSDNFHVSGSRSAVLAIANITADDAANYRVIVTNSAGSVTSAPAALSITANAGAWTPVAAMAPGEIGLMLLLSDGTVMAASSSDGSAVGNLWYRLSPDSRGSYANGTWSSLASMADTRLWFSSQVLQDGRVFVAGGEYGTGKSTAEVYDPLADAWTAAPVPTALLDPTKPSPIVRASVNQEFSDSQSRLLPNGTVMLAPVGPNTNGGTLIYNATANTWAAGPTHRSGYQDEASWVKLPDDSILTIDPFGTNSERYIPALNQWVTDAPVPVAVYEALGGELGAAFLLADGRAFFIGGSSHTVFYTPSGSAAPGAWSVGPDLPGGLTAPDAAAAMMRNGKILCALSTPLYQDDSGQNQFPYPISFFEFDPVSNSLTQVLGPTGTTDPSSLYTGLMLDLPDGGVLYSHFGSDLYIYYPAGAQLTSGKPTITSISPNVDGSYHLVGTQLNGISEGAAYGDDAQMDSNYPLVRMTNNSNGNIYYARTYNWSSTSVMSSNLPVTTEFAVPASAPAGNYSLVVVANGISSDLAQFCYRVPPAVSLQPASQTLALLSTTAFSLTSSGCAPLSYQWTKNGANIGGATASSFSISNAMVSDSGNFQVVVTNAYAAVTSSVSALTVLKATPLITWTNPASIAAGVALGPNQLNATASVPGTFIYSPSTGAILGAGTNLLSTTFTPTDTNDYNAVTASVSIVVYPANPLLLLAGDGNFGFRSNAFGFDLSGNLGQTVVIERSTDLLNWLPITTGAFGSQPLYFSDPTSSNSPSRFYRGRIQ